MNPTKSKLRRAYLVSLICGLTGCLAACTSPAAGSTIQSSATHVGGITGRELDPGLLSLHRYPARTGRFDRFSAAERRGWAAESFYPIGVWNESVVEKKDVEIDQAAGINTYFDLTPNSDLGLVREAGMSAVLPVSFPQDQVGPETVGWLLSDEPEQRGVDNVLTELNSQLYQIGTRDRDLSRFTYTNFTGNAALPVYAPPEDLVKRWFSASAFSSMDIYWYTASGFCKGSVGGEVWKDGSGPAQRDGAGFNDLSLNECQRPSNYAYVVDRTAQLAGLESAFAIIENGQPFASAEPRIQPQQMAAAIWASVAAGARGVIYFNHTFASQCEGQHNLRQGSTPDDPCYSKIRQQASDTNKKLTILAPVLNADHVAQGLFDNVRIAIKAYQGSLYVIALPGPVKGGSAIGSFSLNLKNVMSEFPPAARGDVLFENRPISVINGVLKDSFATDTSVHIYKLSTRG